MRQWITLGAALALAACGGNDEGAGEVADNAPETLDTDGTAIAVTSVQYMVICHLSEDCPSFDFFVEAGKSGVFNGKQGVEHIGMTDFAYDQKEYDALVSDVLDVLDGEEVLLIGKDCAERQDGDLINIDLVSDEGNRKIMADTGCDYEANKEIFAKLRAAAYHLPIETLVGRVGVPEEPVDEE